MSPSTDRPASVPLARLRLIWMGFVVACLVYAVLGWILAQGERPGAEGVPLDLLLPLFGALALGEIALALFGGRILAGFAKGVYSTFCILRWAFVEAVAVYGILLILLGASLTVGLVFIGMAAGVLATLGPNEETERMFAQGGDL